jgi:hypothetical protein
VRPSPVTANSPSPHVATSIVGFVTDYLPLPAVSGYRDKAMRSLGASHCDSANVHAHSTILPQKSRCRYPTYAARHRTSPEPPPDHSRRDCFADGITRRRFARLAIVAQFEHRKHFDMNREWPRPDGCALCLSREGLHMDQSAHQNARRNHGDPKFQQRTIGHRNQHGF